MSGKAYDEVRHDRDAGEGREQGQRRVHGGLRDQPLRERHRGDAGAEQAEVGTGHEALVQVDPVCHRGPQRDRERDDRPRREAVDPAEVTRVQPLDAERAERDPIHGHEPDPADPPVQQVTFA